jgi:hypothetical protein
MRAQMGWFSRLVWPVVTCMAVCLFACFAPGMPRGVAAQSGPLSGSFGFMANGWMNDPADSTGAAILGVLNLDGSGSASGTYTLQLAGGQAQSVSGAFTGTYAGNPDGTGTLTIVLDAGLGLTFATVVTDGGQGMQLISTSGSGDASNLSGGAAVLRGSQQSLTGALPVGLFNDFPASATGNIPVTLTGTSIGGGTIYTTSSGSGNGTQTCDDGSTGNWNARIASFTMAMQNGGQAGDYLIALIAQACGGDPQIRMLSGQATANANPAGGLAVTLHGSGALVRGTARAAQAGPPSGAYGVEFSSSPIPTGLVGVMNFDGAGNVTLSFTNVGAPGNGPQLTSGSGSRTGTYTVNPDGSGTITLAPGSGQTVSPAYVFVMTDGGAGMLLLRTDLNTGANVVFGTGRQQ